MRRIRVDERKHPVVGGSDGLQGDPGLEIGAALNVIAESGSAVEDHRDIAVRLYVQLGGSTNTWGSEKVV